MAFLENFGRVLGGGEAIDRSKALNLETRRLEADVFNQAESRKLQRAQLAETKRNLDAQLTEKGYDPNTLGIVSGGQADATKQQLAITQQSLKALQGKLAAQETDKALLEGARTGQWGLLNQKINNDPVLKQAWGSKGIQSISNIDWNNDRRLLASIGLKPSEYDTPEKQALQNKNLYKTLNNNGQWELNLVNDTIKETGAVSRLGGTDSQIFSDNLEQYRSFMSGPRSSANTAEGHKYENEINDAVAATGGRVPANLIAAMMHKESTNDPNAVSTVRGKTYSGLMQVGQDAANEVGIPNIDTPTTNIMAGTLYMDKLLKKYDGDLAKALAAYNSGPGTVDKVGGIPKIKETQDYVNTIMNNFAAGESYYNAGNEAIKEGKQLSKTSNEDNTIATINAYIRDKALAEKGSTPALEERKMKVEEGTVENTRLTALAKLKTEGTTANQKDLTAATEKTSELVNMFGGQDTFDKTDFSDPKNYNKAYPLVRDINKLGSTEFSEKDKENLTDIRQVIGLAKTASKLRGSKTGLIDKYFTDISKYISDNPEGIDAIAAKQAIDNILIKTLSGSAVSSTEFDRNIQAMGKNTQQLGPVLTQFKVSLDQFKSRLDSVAANTNPVTAKVLIGVDRNNIDNLSNKLQERIDYIGQLVNPKTQGKLSDTDAAPILQSIFGTGK